MTTDVLMWVGGIIVSGLFSLIGWVFKMVFSSIKDVEKSNSALADKLQRHKLHAAETFATKVDVDRGFDRVMDKLDSIDDKLDNKADKNSVQ